MDSSKEEVFMKLAIGVLAFVLGSSAFADVTSSMTCQGNLKSQETGSKEVTARPGKLTITVDSVNNIATIKDETNTAGDGSVTGVFDQKTMTLKVRRSDINMNIKFVPVKADESIVTDPSIAYFDMEAAALGEKGKVENKVTGLISCQIAQ